MTGTRAVVLGFTVVVLLAACEDHGPRKIQLAADAAGASMGSTQASILRINTGRLVRVGVLRFHNQSGDRALDWLENGLADMLLTELQTATHLVLVTPARMAELIAASGASDDSPEAALGAARAGDVETVLGGSFRREGAELVIEAEIRDAGGMRPVVRESARVESLERIFSGVAELGQQVRARLRSNPEQPASERGLVATESVEAYRLYTAAKVDMEKLMVFDARVKLEQAVREDPGFALAWYELAKACISGSDLKAGMAAWDKADANSARLSEAERLRLDLIKAQFQGDTDAVLALADKIWERAPHDLDARIGLALWLEHQGERERALRELQLIREEDPTRKLAYNSLGYLYAARGDFTTALRFLETYRDMTPGEPNAHDSIGEVLAMAGRFDEAKRAFENALAQWPTFENSAARLAEIEVEMGDFDAARAASDRWIQVASNTGSRARPWAERAVMLYRFGRSADMAAALGEARRAEPDSLMPGYVELVRLKASGDVTAFEGARRAWLEHWRGAPARANWDAAMRLRFLLIAAALEAPAGELLALIDGDKDPEEIRKFRDFKRVVRAVLLYRTGKVAEAREWLAGAGGEAVAGLVAQRHVDRTSFWKLLGELVSRDPGAAAQLDAVVAKAAERTRRPDLLILSRLLAIHAATAAGAPEAARAGYAELGIAPEEAWRVAGPYRRPDGFRFAFAPETGSGATTWKEPSDGVRDGWLDFGPALGYAPLAVSYASTVVVSPDRRVVQLRMGSPHSLALWVNGEPVWRFYRKEEARLDQDLAQVYLKPGENRVLVKAVATALDAGFYLRVTDSAGAGFPDLRFQAPR